MTSNVPWWSCIHCDSKEYVKADLTNIHVPMIECVSCRRLHSFPDPESARALRWELEQAKARESVLYEALQLADAMLSGANMNVRVVYRKVRAALASVDTHPQGGNSPQSEVPFMGSAVPAEQQGDAQPFDGE